MIPGLTGTALLREGRKTLTLSIPLIIGQLSQMLMGIADTAMVGKIGVTELAALAFANNIFYIFFVVGIGVLISISVRTSTAAGRDEPEIARGICRNGFFLSLLAGAALAALACCVIPFLPFMGQDPGVVVITPPFLILILISIVPALGSMALKQHADALDHPWPSFWIFLSGVGINILLNQLFIFEMGYGLVGAGIATLISRTLILIAMLVWINRSRRIADFVPRRWLMAPDKTELRRLLAIGVPSSIQLLCEVSAFSVSGILVGLFGEVSLAAHQLALTTAGTFFMVPLGLSMALTVRVGNVLGSGEHARFPALIASGWILTLFFVCCSGVFCSLNGEWIASLYVDKEPVIRIATQLLIIVGLFQIFDGLQIASASILRGFEDVKRPAWIVFFCYWVLSIPLGWVLATTFHWGSVGIWSGLAVGLALAAILLSLRVVSVVSALKPAIAR